MSFEILFFLFSSIILTSALVVISARNPIHSVLFLILVFVNVIFILIHLEVEFLALTFVIVYVGAVAVLFLFVVMMLNIKIVELNLSRFHFFNFNERMQILFNIGFVEPILPNWFSFTCVLMCIFVFIFHKVRLELLILKNETARFLVKLMPFSSFFIITLYFYLKYASISNFYLICVFLLNFLNLIGVLSCFVLFFIYMYEKDDL